jgi:two-component sensor histidine kinase
VEPGTEELVGRYTSVETGALTLAEKVAGLTVRDFRISRESWPVSQVTEHGQAVFTPDLIRVTTSLLPQLPESAVKRAVRLTGVRSDTTAIYLPLKVEEQVIGIMTVWCSDLREEDVPAFSVFANQVAVALENARLYEVTSASLQEKEVLLKEIHHRVKNNLQIISSLLNLQSGHIDDPQATEVFQDSQHRVRSMALVHEKLYQSQDLAWVGFAEYIRNLATYLFRAYSASATGVTLDIQADDVFLTIDTAVPCGLILNELISNALKHAFPDGQAGEIHVELHAHGYRQVTLSVADTGIGLPNDLDLNTTTSLGLQLVHTLVDQLNGHIELNGIRGTEFNITFAVPENQGASTHE